MTQLESPIHLSARGRRMLRWVVVFSAVVGALLGLETVILHLSTDPLVDIRRYWEAGRRLNEGLPLYGLTSADTTATYMNPPLLAILFRPLALLPFPIAAATWEGVVLASLALTVWRAGLTRRTLVVVCWLALPIGWAVVIGQAEIVLGLLLAIGSPFAVALAGTVKIFPWVVAVYWMGRRDWRSLARLVGWIAVLFAVQLVVEPAGTLAFIRLEWLNASFDVRNVSLWVIHPIVWFAGAGVAALVALRFAGTRWGWAAAVVLTAMANPRLLVYQLSSLLGGLAGPGDRPREPATPGMRAATVEADAPADGRGPASPA